MLDIRMPISGLFIVLGCLLGLYGSSLPPSAYASAGINLDLWWGGAMAFFGIAMGLWRLLEGAPASGQAQAKVPAASSEAVSSSDR